MTINDLGGGRRKFLEMNPFPIFKSMYCETGKIRNRKSSRNRGAGRYPDYL